MEIEIRPNIGYGRVRDYSPNRYPWVLVRWSNHAVSPQQDFHMRVIGYYKTEKAAQNALNRKTNGQQG